MDIAWHQHEDVLRASAAGEYGTVLRHARKAAGLDQKAAGDLLGFSHATVSRWESGAAALRDITVLRLLAQRLRIPPHILGLSEENPMHRRTVLQGLAAVGAASFSGLGIAPGAGQMISGLDRALHVASAGELPPVDLSTLNAMIHQGWKHFSAVRFTELSATLPALISTAESSRAAAPSGAEAVFDAALSKAYVLANELTIKRHMHDVSLLLADRGARAARASGDPEAQARAQWRLAISLRRSKHRDIAESIALKAAAEFRETGLADPKAAGFYSRLLCCAAYSAALEGHRASALENLQAAEDALREFPHATELRGFGVDSYQVSIHRMLGDFGTALHAAQQVRIEQLPSVERQTRYLEDKAIALDGAGKRAETLRLLLITERIAPDETRMRPWVKRLALNLLEAPSHTIGISGAREFARRNGLL